MQDGFGEETVGEAGGEDLHAKTKAAFDCCNLAILGSLKRCESFDRGVVRKDS